MAAYKSEELEKEALVPRRPLPWPPAYSDPRLTTE
jgi:hypothetical protein